MSQKWIRSKKWDDEHIPRALWPLKLVLRVFSSVTFAIVLLVGVSLYGTAASVPVGLIALAPTYLIYGLTLGVAMALVALLPTWVALRGLRAAGVGSAGRFAFGMLAMIGLSVAGAWMWHAFVWPSLKYNEVTGAGFRLFKEFVQTNQSVTVRRLRGMEMSELEFYGWWPLKVMLLMFVANLVFATVRRIEFTFKNLGVLTVHSGIVTMALGSMWYSALKEEGDMVLESGAADSTGMPAPGPGESWFYDNTVVALWMNMGRNWEMRPLRGVPRYNDYNLDALGAGKLADDRATMAGEHVLDVVVPPGPPAKFGPADIDPGVEFRVVGYASYADLVTQFVEPRSAAATNGRLTGAPAWWVTVSAASMGLERRLPFWPTMPRGRLTPLASVLNIEFTKGMTDERWTELQTELPAGAVHALVLTVGDERRVVAAEVAKTTEVGGYTVTVSQLLPEPPFPIITPGYQGGKSSVAVVAVTSPTGERFERYVYHRFPEINQDMVAQVSGGMPARRDADPGIKIGYVDASVSQVYLDEVFGSERAAGGVTVRAILRPRGGQATVTLNLHRGSKLPIGSNIELELAERWDDSVELETPVPVDPARRDNKDLGTHRFAAAAVEVKVGDWKRVLWLPFSQYVFKEMNQARTVDLPDGRRLMLSFGRMMRRLPGLELQLKDFQMIPHPFGGPTQDFRSELVVSQVSGEGTEQSERSTSLNDPLLVRVPYQPRSDVPAIANAVMRVVSVIAPVQYKFSQAGWDAQGWNLTEQEAAAGLRPRAVARWTILGVGNNPGIYVIAAGAVMMAVGTPWAFYIKPWLVRREKKKIQDRLARERAATPDSVEREIAGVKS